MDKIHGEIHLSVEARLAQIWQDILGLKEPPGLNDDFFDLGGDSLLATHVVSNISLSFGCELSLREFLFNPSISELSRTLMQTDQSSPDGEALEQNEAEPVSAAPWGLPADIFQQIRTFVSRWQGERICPDSLIVGLNVSGTRSPLFWVFQGQEEFLQLAQHLGQDQPLYGMRSGNVVMSYTEDNIQALALIYVNEMQKVRPEGPLMIGGNCGGAILALAIAQHLQRRRRHVPLLILMEWAFDLEPYTGSVVLVFGRESEFSNPWQRYQIPELAWCRAFRDYDVEVIPGEHGRFFGKANVQILANTVKTCMDKAMIRAPERLPLDAKHIKIELNNPPVRLMPGTRAQISVRVSNCSQVHWNGGDRSGLMLVNYWKWENGNMLQKKDGHIALPQLAPGEKCYLSLPVTAPLQTGESLLVVHALEDGAGWFSDDGSTAQCSILLSDRLLQNNEIQN